MLPSVIAAPREAPRPYEQALLEAPRRWLVTGAAGFIGSHLVEALLALGQEVVALDNFSTGTRANLEAARASAEAGRLRVVEGDIRDRDLCERACDGARHVLHQAALGSVPRSIAAPLETLAVNVTGFTNVLEATRACGATIVYASSSSVYGDAPELPKREEAIGRPLSPYAASKRADELIAASYRACYGLACVGLRYFNVIGARQRPDGPYAAVVPRWIDALARGEAPVVFGDGLTSRDFCPVANVVEANLRAACLDDPDDPLAIYNVALGERTTLLELLSLLQSALAARGAPCQAIEPRREPPRAGDIRHSLADISRARDRLGYAPRVSLREGLERAIDDVWPRG
ncbi:MAG: NAD-dependent epimerase/dehydratase family protein [Myxococcales bacterium]|nr:NAD-dependent epimerase/dehydratase family protein [Myxococcales bacterium]